MQLLDIDTDALRAGVTSAKRTNEAITEACNLLNQVVIHNDWECYERTAINNNTIANRQKAQEIRDNANAFYNAVEQASGLFDEAEQRNLTRTNGVDSHLGEILSVVPGFAGGSPSIVAFDNINESLEG